MAVKQKVIIAILVIVVLGVVGTGAYFYFSKDSDSPLPNVVEKDSYTFPLTGLKTENEEDTKMRPLCVKIPNDSKARPQYEINKADIIYETMVEGGETRLNAIFQSNVPEEVWPVRSARLSDVWIVPQYNGMLFFSGANSQVDAAIANNNITNMCWTNAQSIYFRTDNGRGNLHNLTIQLQKSYELAEEKGYETKSETPVGLHFEGIKYDESGAADNSANSGDSKLDAVDDSGLSGSALKVNIAGNSRIEFKWDEEKERYLKWFNDKEHFDAATDEQVNAVNVVILWAQYDQQAKKDAAGSPTYDTVLGGKGDAAIFKGGKRYDCQWEADKTTPPRFYDNSGEEIFLNPGNSYIVVPPIGRELTSE